MAATTTKKGKPKMGSIGLLEVKVFEVRDLPNHYVSASSEFLAQSTPIHKKKQPNQQYDSSLFFPVNRQQAIVKVEVFKKRLIGQDRCVGFLSFPVSELPNESEAQWYDLHCMSAAAGASVAVSDVTSAATKALRRRSRSLTQGVSQQSDDTNRKRSSSIGSPKPIMSPALPRPEGCPGRIRLSFQLTSPELVREPLKGTTIEGEWTKETAGGDLIGNPFWYANSQYLITVSSRTEVSITLRQPVEEKEPCSFYIIKYDDEFYKGRRLAVFERSDIFLIQGEQICPIFKLEVSIKEVLPIGCYVIIPVTADKPIEGTDMTMRTGKFTLAIAASRMEAIHIQPLPTEEDKFWSEIKLQGAWTKETSGGADITNISWSSNPQYLLTLVKKSNICVLLNQLDTTYNSVGFYLISVTDVRYKAVIFANQVGGTPACSPSRSVGITIPQRDSNGDFTRGSLKPGNYIIIPCTYEPATVGNFEIVVHSVDPDAKLTPLIQEWPHKRSVKGKWRGEFTGGSPNHNTFTKNPQFLFTLPSLSSGQNSVLIQLTQSSSSSDELAKVGMVVFDRQGKSVLQPSECLSDNVLIQSEGWTAHRSVFCECDLPVDKATHLLVVPCTFTPGVKQSFRLYLYSSRKSTVDVLLGAKPKHEKKKP